MKLLAPGPLRSSYARRRLAGFTLAEVMVATALILVSLGGIFAMHGQSLSVIRAARESGSASQVLQQRIEQMRLSGYAKAVTSSSLVAMMDAAAGATDGEREMAGVKNFQETVTISTYARPGVSPAPPIQSFTVTRRDGVARSNLPANLQAEPTVKADLRVTWTDRAGNHHREFSTLMSEGGINTAAIGKRADAGSAGTEPKGNSSKAPTPTPAPPAPPPPPPSTGGPTPPPKVCKHGRPWPHCGQP